MNLTLKINLKNIPFANQLNVVLIIKCVLKILLLLILILIPNISPYGDFPSFYFESSRVGRSVLPLQLF